MDKKNKSNSSTIDKKNGSYVGKTDGKKVDLTEKNIKIHNSKDFKPIILGKDGGGGHSKR